MVTLKADLSPKSLENLMKDLKLYAKQLEEVKLDIHQALADYVYERIMEYVPVDTGQLKASILKDVSKEIATVYTDLEYARFVEFGTGIRGRGSDEDNTKYDTSRLNIKELSYSEEFQGQPARKFMYKAVLDLEQDYMEIVKNVLKEKGLI